MSTSENAKGSKWIAYLIEGAILVLALVLVLVIRLAVYEPALVISKSMEPALQVDDRILIDHRESLHGQWRRGDIVLFYAPQSWDDELSNDMPREDRDQLIKRVVGLPGERVDVVGDKVSITENCSLKAISNPHRLHSFAPGVTPNLSAWCWVEANIL
jgi:signal peptidase I